MSQETILLSALQHYLFCPRQCGLIHIEQVWEENNLTIIGNQMHEKVHADKPEKRKDLIKSHGLYISSEKYGLSGQCDLVEFYKIENINNGVKLPNHSDYWRPFPVEYKKGKPKKDNCDKVQLCAQALCIEEMLHCNIEDGALYYGTQHHRISVDFNAELREETISVINSVHQLFRNGNTPKPEYSSKCRSCSLLDRCQPKQFEYSRKSIYIKSIFEVI